MPRISVVVPVYNVEDYLALSLQSVRNQDFRDIEIVCVNDGSTDSSLAVLRLFERVDERVVVIDKPNGGLSSARNAGIKVATGDIVCFLDSDDLLVEDACSKVVAAFDRSDADVVTYGGIAYPEFRSYPWLEEVLSPRAVDYKRFSTDILFKEASRPFAWRTACKRAFLERASVLFDETLKFGEDQLFHFALYPRANKTSFIPDKLVRYRVSRAGSLMNRQMKDPLKMSHEHLNIIEYIVKDWQNGGFLQRYPEKLLLWTVDFLGFDIMQLDDPGRTEMLDAMKELWVRSFRPEVIDECSRHEAAGEIVRAVMGERELAHGGTRRFIVYRYYAWRYGKRAAIGRAFNAVESTRPIACIKECISRTRTSADIAASQEREWEMWDENERKLAFERVQEEAMLIEQAAQSTDFSKPA